MNSAKRSDNALISLMAYSIPKDLAQKSVDAGYNLTKIRAANKSDLTNHFTDDEADFLKKQIERQPIPDDVVERLVEECHWRCCICWNYDNALPVVLHHIEEYAKTQDNSYENIVALCPNHHASAHTSSTLGQGPLTVQLIHSMKARFIEALAQMVAGKRVAPGRENQPEAILRVSAQASLENFRQQRIQKIAAGNTPVALFGRPKLVMHLATWDAFTSGRKVNRRYDMIAPKPFNEWGSYAYPNHEGVLFINHTFAKPTSAHDLDVDRVVSNRPEYSYLQLFTNGILESVDTRPFLGWHDDPVKKASGSYVVEKMIASFGNLLDAAAAVPISPPAVLCVSFVGVQDFYIRGDGEFDSLAFRASIGCENLITDPIALSDFSFDDKKTIGGILRPVADELYQSSGWMEAAHFDASGYWIEPHLRTQTWPY